MRERDNDGQAHLVFFDFDKTLVRGDSFRRFAEVAACGYVERFMLLYRAVQFKLGHISNARYKEEVLKCIWQERGEEQRRDVLEALYRVLEAEIMPKVCELMDHHVKGGHRVVILSASPELYLQPFIERWRPGVEVRGTRFAERAGTYEVDALYGGRKACVARGMIDAVQPDQVWVYTDHLSDLPLIRLAQHVRLVEPSRALVRCLEQDEIKYEVIA